MKRLDQKTSLPSHFAAAGQKPNWIKWLSASSIFLTLLMVVFLLSDRVAEKTVVGFPNFHDSEFALLDQNGETRFPSDFAGKPIALFFGFTYCPDICPTTLYDLSQVKRELVALGIAEDDIQFVFISVDPERDKAAQIKRYVQYFDASFLGATGSIGQLTNLTRQLGAPFRAEPETAENVYEVTHSSAVYLVDPLVQYAGVISPPFVASEVAADFEALYRQSIEPSVALRH